MTFDTTNRYKNPISSSFCSLCSSNFSAILDLPSCIRGTDLWKQNGIPSSITIVSNTNGKQAEDAKDVMESNIGVDKYKHHIGECFRLSFQQEIHGENPYPSTSQASQLKSHPDRQDTTAEYGTENNGISLLEKSHKNDDGGIPTCISRRSTAVEQAESGPHLMFGLNLIGYGDDDLEFCSQSVDPEVYMDLQVLKSVYLEKHTIVAEIKEDESRAQNYHDGKQQVYESKVHCCKTDEHTKCLTSKNAYNKKDKKEQNMLKANDQLSIKECKLYQLQLQEKRNRKSPSCTLPWKMKDRTFKRFEKREVHRDLLDPLLFLRGLGRKFNRRVYSR